MANGNDINAFMRGYITSALWTGYQRADDGSDCNDNLEDYDSRDIDRATLAEMVQDCRDFQEFITAQLARAEIAGAADLVAIWQKIQDEVTADPERAGHNFNLTRNRHGAGFWDGGWTYGAHLTEAAHSYGTFQLYLADDGIIYHHS